MEVSPLMIYLIGIADHVRDFSVLFLFIFTGIFLVFLI